MSPVDFAELFRQTEEAIADYQARMRAVPHLPARRPVRALWRGLRDYALPAGGGAWLLAQGMKDEIFIPIDQEGLLRPVLH